MKVPELYTYEIAVIHSLLHSYASDIEKEAAKVHRGVMRRKRFWPFGINEHLMIAGIKMQLLANQMEQAKQLKDKLMESTGFDDDGKKITFREMISNNSSQK
jgi:hypothetical protein